MCAFMKNIVIIPNVNKPRACDITREVIRILFDLNINVYVDEKYGEEFVGCAIGYSHFPEYADLICVIGGDGSVIDASVIAVEKDIPVLGINLGNLGYLAEIEPDSLAILKRLTTGEYRIVEKMLLGVKKISGDNVTCATRLAVNDIIISHEGYLGIADFTMITEDFDSFKLRADGMIFSTPAGSTAYSLSAGGPIIDHGINAILATPICPHSFFNRSIIFNENEALTIENNGKSELKISIDGRLFDSIDAGERCTVFKSSKTLKTLTFSPNNTFQTLFGKMKKIENM